MSRTRRQYERLLGQSELETLVSDGPRPAYLSYRGDDPASVLEFGGDWEGIVALLERAIAEAGTVAVYTHPRHPLAAAFRDIAAKWGWSPHRKLNVLNLPATLTAYRPLLEERWAAVGDSFEGTVGEITLGMNEGTTRPGDPSDTRTQSATISYDASGVAVERTDRDPDLELGPRETVEFLFGPRDVRRSIAKVEPFLDAVLPLEYYFWQTETI